MKTKKKTFRGKMYEFVTINEIAKGSNRSLPVIRKFIERGILPDSNLRMPSIVTPKKEIMGARIYTKQLAEKLCEIIKTFRQGIPVTEEQKAAINKAFNEEKTELQL